MTLPRTAKRKALGEVDVTASDGVDAVLIEIGSVGPYLAPLTAGCVCRGNPLRDGWAPPSDARGRIILAWSGTLGEGLFDAHPATWLRPGHEALRELCRRVAPDLAARGQVLCFRPHARHVLSDAQSALSFAREQEDAPFGVALAPASMLEPSMLDDVEDHLRRAFEALGPVAMLVVREDVRVDGDEVVTVVPGEGVMPLELFDALLDEHVPVTTPVVFDRVRRGDR